MRTPTRTLVTACALAAALLVAGCGGAGDENSAEATGELFLQPARAQGPSPFTRSAATAAAPPTRMPRLDPTAPRTVSGGTPGLYGGTERVGSCDVPRQIGDLTADPSRTRAFAQVAGVSPAAVPDYLRGLAPVVLRADTRVTDHGYRGGRASGFQSVLQAGTAVLVDNRGVPRVRCACGNPLTPPVAMRGGAVISGQPWSGYRPTQVIVVAPSEQLVTDITIIDLVDNSWIERRIHHDCRHDHAVPPPTPEPLTPTAPPGDSASPDTPFGADPQRPAPDCPTRTATATPGATVTPGPTATPTAKPYDEGCPATGTPPSTKRPGTPVLPPGGTRTTVPADPGTGIGPETVPDTPDLPDGGGLIPDEPAAPTGTGTVFGSPTDVFGA
ncbi:DUF6777 domain-containing protein [Streptomyces canus]|uniref:DUF6777 domain-containing protein n=1 Tax=Streptomyces canus TaxID=58343 RepID=UPI00037ED628|nr:DUF6777 domain-containing protein [Streptomyces canus]